MRIIDKTITILLIFLMNLPTLFAEEPTPLTPIDGFSFRNENSMKTMFKIAENVAEINMVSQLYEIVIPQLDGGKILDPYSTPDNWHETLTPYILDRRSGRIAETVEGLVDQIDIKIFQIINGGKDTVTRDSKLQPWNGWTGSNRSSVLLKLITTAAKSSNDGNTATTFGQRIDYVYFDANSANYAAEDMTALYTAKASRPFLPNIPLDVIRVVLIVDHAILASSSVDEMVAKDGEFLPREYKDASKRMLKDFVHKIVDFNDKMEKNVFIAVVYDKGEQEKMVLPLPPKDYRIGDEIAANNSTTELLFYPASELGIYLGEKSAYPVTGSQDINDGNNTLWSYWSDYIRQEDSNSMEVNSMNAVVKAFNNNQVLDNKAYARSGKNYIYWFRSFSEDDDIGYKDNLNALGVGVLRVHFETPGKEPYLILGSPYKMRDYFHPDTSTSDLKDKTTRIFCNMLGIVDEGVLKPPQGTLALFARW